MLLIYPSNNMIKIIGAITLITVSLFAFQSCRTGPPIKMAEKVNLDLFMGDWYVIANIPTFIEKGAHNAVESYKLIKPGVIDTLFSFNKDSFTGPVKQYNPTGFVTDDPSNAAWKMQFLWPFKSEFIIVYIDPAYEYSIIGRTKRDYLWIMARKPKISERQLNQLVQIAIEQGYDKDKIKRVPQQ